MARWGVASALVVVGAAWALGCRPPAVEGARNPSNARPSAATRIAPAPPVEQPPTEGPRCLSLSAPLGMSLVRGERGDLYAITLDAYLHVYDADLAHRFSFSLEGTPIAALPLRDGILVASASRIFASVSERGVERYHFRTLSRPLFGLTRDRQRRVLFVGADGFVYAMSETGRAHYRVELPDDATGAPVVDGSGVVWVPLRSGVARLDGARTPRVYRVDEPVAKLGVGSEGLWVVFGDRLASLDSTGRLEERGRGPEILVDSGVALVRGQPDRVELFGERGRRVFAVDAASGPLRASRSWLWWNVPGALRGRSLRNEALREWIGVGDVSEVVEFDDGLAIATTRTQQLCLLVPGARLGR